MLKFCLDTSVLINGWHRRYHPDVFPSIWEILAAHFLDQTVFSCEEVFIELSKQDDELFSWIKRFKTCFLSPTEEVLTEMAEVMRTFPNFAATGGTLNRADPWIVAQAKISNAIVVTDEQRSDKSSLRKPPKLPVACEALGVRWMRPIDLLAELKVKL